jgi:hypothetical protein
MLRAALIGGISVAAVSAKNASVRGSVFPKIDSSTWEGWSPDSGFEQQFKGWADKPVPDEVTVWCNGFIPAGVPDEEIISGMHTIPITGPGGIPIPGLLGQCASTDGRDYSNKRPDSDRPSESRFWSWLSVARGRGGGVSANAKCGQSHNVCCNKKGCWGGSNYGDVTCNQHCPDEEMKVIRQACWTNESIANGWPSSGSQCQGGSIVAAKAYFQGRGGNPCGQVLGVSPPPASWDIGVAIFPSKRKVTITGYTDDAPSTECYASARDNGIWGEPVTLARLPMDTSMNIAIALAGFSDRPVNPKALIFDLPDPSVLAPSKGEELIV